MFAQNLQHCHWLNLKHRMSKPPHRAKEEENLSSGSDTESESDEDEDTVSQYFNRIVRFNLNK